MSEARRRAERDRIEPQDTPLTGRRVSAPISDGRIGHDVRSQILAIGLVAKDIAGTIQHQDSKRRSRLKRPERRNLPTTRQRIQHGAVIQPAPPVAEGQLDDGRYHQPVRHMIGRKRALVVAERGAIAASKLHVVDPLGKRIGQYPAEAVAKAALGFEGEGVEIIAADNIAAAECVISEIKQALARR